MKKLLTLVVLTLVSLCIFASCDKIDSILFREGLYFTSNDDGTCYVMGIDGFTDTNIEIPFTSPDGDRVTSIGEGAFYYCTGLTSIVIPDSVTSIGLGAFAGCTGLTSIVIPDSVTSIGRFAFENCTGLTSIVIPDSVTSIGYGAFYSCTGLTSITVDEDNTSYQSIDGNLYSKDGKTLIQYAIGKKNTSFTIPDSVTSIGNRAFYGCTGLTSIEIGDSVTSIGENAFYNCTGLTDVYYTGTEAEWEKISIDNDNEYLTNATIHYNYVPKN